MCEDQGLLSSGGYRLPDLTSGNLEAVSNLAGTRGTWMSRNAGTAKTFQVGCTPLSRVPFRPGTASEMWASAFAG
jgi:hypothetical protein